MKVVYKEPGKAAEVRDIENDLPVLQGLVGGYIEALNVVPPLLLICNEEGKLRGLQPNLDLRGRYDVIVGPVLFTKSNSEGDFVSLNDIDIAKANDIVARTAV
jgi:hypothetical protein